MTVQIIPDSRRLPSRKSPQETIPERDFRLVDIRNQVGTKRTIHAGGLEISSFTAQQQTLAFFVAGFRGAIPCSQAGNKNAESRDGLFAGILAETAVRTYAGGLFVGKRKPAVS
jgi:hypothetical protein